MGLAIRTNVNAPWYSKIVNPVPAKTLEGWFDLSGGQLSRIGYNRAPGKPDAIRHGVPTLSGTHAAMSYATGFLETRIEETADFTWLVLGKVPGALGGTGTTTAAPYIGNYQAANDGAQLYHITDTSLTGNAVRDNGSGGTTSASATISTSEAPTDWGIRTQRTGDGSGGTRINNLTTGQTSLQSFVGVRILAPSRYLRIGATHSTGTFQGTVHVSLAVAYSALLTDAELALVEELMLAHADRVGIAI